MPTVRCLLLFGIVLSGAHDLSGDDFPPIYDSEPNADVQPLAADEAAARMEVPVGFHVNVFAAEPDVQNPIALTWDDRGRMWVAENYTYAERAQRFDLSLRDRVLIFEDRDHDGQADSRTVFTDQVQMLTSVEVGHGGVWLMCPPNLLFLPDANEDDIPDGPAQVVLDGFTVAESNYHNFANGLSWGPDGWLYGRCGHSCPGNIGAPGTPDDERIPIDGGIWRYHPHQKTVEVLCHGTVNPWGHDWDRHGELFFINTVIGHLWHAIPGAHFKESFGESNNTLVYHRLDTIADHFHFDTEGSWAGSRDGSANQYGGGHAHIGMMIYQGHAWPNEYRDKLFTLNMHGRRANVEILQRHGAGYVGRHGQDFCLSPDPFFRGIEISTGPDGNAYILDWSDTGECHEHTGVHRQSGRIFKVSYGTEHDSRPLTKPACLSGNGPLPDLWRRYQNGETTTDELLALLDQQDEHLRVWAIRLITDHWPLDTMHGPHPDALPSVSQHIIDRFAQLARQDDSGLVLLTLASTLGRLPVHERSKLAAVLVTRAEFQHDPQFPAMIWYGLMPVAQQAPQQLSSVARQCALPATLQWITRTWGAMLDSQRSQIDELLVQASAMSPECQLAILRGLDDALRVRRQAAPPKSWQQFSSLPVITAQQETLLKLNTVFGQGRSIEELHRDVLDSKIPLPTRVAALESIISAQPQNLRNICESVLQTRTLNATAARGLATINDPAVGELLAANYRRFHPEDRPQLIEILVSRPTFAKALLNHLDKRGGSIPAAQLSAFHARQILGFEDAELTALLQTAWGNLRDTPAELRRQMDELRIEMQQATFTAEDLSHGRSVFQQTCSRCHRLYGEGEAIGPDLTGSQRSNLDYLLHNILDPSAVVGADYRMHVLALRDGRVLNGLVVRRDKTSLILQTATDKLELPVDEIVEVKQTSLSSMPEGLLKPLSREQVLHLLAYLQHPHQVPPLDTDVD